MNGDRNVLGGELAECGTDPLTGFYRDGCCNTGAEDFGNHTVCAVASTEFLAQQRHSGNDLVTPRPELGFAGLQVVGEMMLGSGAWEISFGLAPPDKHGQYQGFFGTGVAVARMLGPLLLTALIITWGTPGWLVLGVLFAGAGFAIGPAVRWASQQRARVGRDVHGVLP